MTAVCLKNKKVFKLYPIKSTRPYGPKWVILKIYCMFNNKYSSDVCYFWKKPGEGQRSIQRMVSVFMVRWTRSGQKFNPMKTGVGEFILKCKKCIVCLSGSEQKQTSKN